MKKKIRIKVVNRSGKNISRANYFFPFDSEKEVVVEKNGSQHREIRCCSSLDVSIVSEVDHLPTNQATKEDAETSKVEAPVVAMKGKENTPREYPCPYCDFGAKSKAGLTHHVRLGHAGQYEEYKAMVKK